MRFVHPVAVPKYDLKAVKEISHVSTGSEDPVIFFDALTDKNYNRLFWYTFVALVPYTMNVDVATVFSYTGIWEDGDHTTGFYIFSADLDEIIKVSCQDHTNVFIRKFVNQVQEIAEKHQPTAFRAYKKVSLGEHTWILKPKD